MIRTSAPLLEHADHALFGGSDGPHYDPSVASIVVLIETLLAQVVAGDSGKEQKHINQIEAQRKASGRYIEY